MPVPNTTTFTLQSVTILRIGKSAAKSKIHLRKVQRLLERFSPLNNQLERPTLEKVMI